MNYIPLAAVIGSAFYVILMLLESSLHPVVLPGAILGAVLIGILAGMFVWKSDHTKHIGEMILIWVMILGFVIYRLLRFGGIL